MKRDTMGDESMIEQDATRVPGPSAVSLFSTFFKIGAFTFGGGFAMIPLIRRELVEARHWLSEDEFLDVVGVAQCSPGPVAVNTAVFCGLKVLGVWGAVACVVGVTLPSLITLSVIAAVFQSFKSVEWIERVFKGIRPAVAGLIAHAAWSLGRRTVRTRPVVVLFLAALAASLFLRMHPALAIVAGGVAGALLPWREGQNEEAQQ